ncbi:MAG: shikimate kinase [Clostridia bacterium]|nr:shikimate kinase [Clostridia bacterium]
MTLKSNFILITLVDMEIKNVSSLLSKKLEYYYLNTEELIDYELYDKKKMFDICGVDYLDNQLKKILKNINDFENSVISMSYTTYSNNFSIIDRNKSKVIYLKTTKKQLESEYNKVKENVEVQKNISTKNTTLLSNLGIALMVFNERDKFIRKNCDFEVNYDISNIEKTVKEIMEKIETGENEY